MIEASGPRVVRIFVSSPSDVMAERERVDRAVARINAGLQGLKLQTIRWEQRYYRADSTFQAQIDSPAACEIVISIFWQRLGTPLPDAFERMPDGRPYPSGTVYEVMKAIEARASSQTGLPDVLVYRKLADAAVPVSDREGYRLAHEQRELFLAFWEEWFVTRDGQFRAAYNAFRTTDEFDDILEKHLRAWLADHGYFSRSVTWSLAEHGSPFRGLEAFRPQDEDIFHGREREIRLSLVRLGTRLGETGACLLAIGDSGSGKSSLVRAGLVPRIRRGALASAMADWRYAEMRPGTDPFAALAAALFEAGALPELAESDFSHPPVLAAQLAGQGELAVAPVVRALARAGAAEGQRVASGTAPRMGLILVVDQLEELLADPARRDLADAFGGLLGLLVAQATVVVLATLRSDAYPVLAACPRMLALKDASAVVDVGLPDASSLAEVIRAPARAAGLSYGEADGETLDSLLLADASGAQALPLLEFVLTQLYERLVLRLSRKGLSPGQASPADLVLQIADYRELGGLAGALAAVAEGTQVRQGGTGEAALRTLLRRLVGAGDEQRAIRFALRTARWEEFGQDEAVLALARALVDARILVTGESGDGARTVRLAHESVLVAWPRAARLLAEDERLLRVRADLETAEARWSRHAAASGTAAATSFLLPAGVALAEAEDVRRSDPEALAPRLLAYVERSGERARRGQRRLALAALAFAATALVAALAAGWGWLAQQEAARNAREASRSAEEASRSRDEAVRRLHMMADQTDGFLVNIVQGMQRKAGVTVEAVGALMEEAGRQTDQLLSVDPGDGYIRLVAARAKGMLAENFVELGRVHEADTSAWRCMELTSAVPAAERSLSWAKTTGHCVRALALVAQAGGDLVAALGYAQKATAVWTLLSDADPADAVLAHNVAASRLLVGHIQLGAGHVDDAAATVAETLAMLGRRTAGGTDETLPDDVRLARLDLAAIELRRGRLGEALDAARLAVDASRDQLQRDPLSAYRLTSLAVALGRLAEVRARLPETQDFVAAAEEAVSVRRKIALLDPGHVQSRVGLIRALNVLAIALTRAGRPDEAAKAVREGAGEAREVVRRDDSPSNRRDLTIALNKLSTVELAAGRSEEARAIALESLEVARAVLAAAPSATASADVAAALLAAAEAGDRPDERRTEARRIYEDLGQKGELSPGLKAVLDGLASGPGALKP